MKVKVSGSWGNTLATITPLEHGQLVHSEYSDGTPARENTFNYSTPRALLDDLFIPVWGAIGLTWEVIEE